MKHRVSPFAAAAMLLAAGAVAPAPQATADAPANVTAQRSAPSARSEGMTAPAAQQVQVSRNLFIPTVNIPWTPRRDIIWAGRPRDRTGTPWGSRRYRA